MPTSFLEIVGWKHPTQFLGRNGSFLCNGIEVFAERGTVSLSPITSRGLRGRCSLDVPQEAMPTLVELLQRACGVKGARREKR